MPPVPTPPVRGYSFNDYQTSNPSSPLPGNRVDQEIDRSNSAISALIAWAGQSLDGNGNLKAGTVGTAQLQTDILADVGQASATSAANSATSAANSAGAAAASAGQASGSVASAAAQVLLAQGHANTASAQATLALTSRNEALGFRDTADTAATNAQNSANASAASAAAALLSQNLAREWAIGLGSLEAGVFSARTYAILAGWRPTGTGVAGTAAGTTFAPAGNIAATNVQLALQELDAEKLQAGQVNATSDITAGTLALARLPNLPASIITTGTIDPARLPSFPATNSVIAGGDTIAGLTAPEQAQIIQGTVVILTGGRRWIYTGTGPKTLESNYILLSDMTPDWSEISNKPASFTPAAHTHDASEIVSGTLNAARLPTIVPTAWNLAGSGVQTYTLTGMTLNNALGYLAIVDGVPQIPNTNYTVNSGAQTITFDENIPSGATIDVRQIAGLGNIANVATQAEAEAGALNTVYMTPLRVLQAIVQLVFNTARDIAAVWNLNNNVALRSREAGGTSRAVFLFNASNIMEYGDANNTARYRNFEHNWDAGGVANRMNLSSAGNLSVVGSVAAQGNNVTVGTGTGVRLLVANGGNSAAGDGSLMALQANGVSYFAVGNRSGIGGGAYNPQTVIYTTASEIVPFSNNFYSWGNASFRWSNIVSVSGDFSGTVATGQLDATGPIYSRGAGAAHYFNDRGNLSRFWAWYASGGFLRMFSPTAGDIVLATEAGEMLYGSDIAPTSARAIGYLGTNPVSLGTNYTLALTHAGRAQYITAAGTTTVTIPTNASVAFPQGTIIPFRTFSGATLSLSPAGGVNLYRFDGSGTNAARTLSAFNQAYIEKIGTNDWIAVGFTG